MAQKQQRTRMTRAMRLTKQKATAEISQTRVTATKHEVARKLCHASYALSTLTYT